MTSQIWYKDFVPGEAVTSPSCRITVDDIDRYADLTGEKHPVQMDADFAREAGFNGRIAHGLTSLALIEGLKSDGTEEVSGDYLIFLLCHPQANAGGDT